jgi:septal ring factor EnvC (AmiA/AmiB activator)
VPTEALVPTSEPTCKAFIPEEEILAREAERKAKVEAQLHAMDERLKALDAEAAEITAKLKKHKEDEARNEAVLKTEIEAFKAAFKPPKKTYAQVLK